ncbi:MAG: translation initiation factor IF-2 N-terminal domain-containing protein [Myxococcales bacterium]|nr:translation initiation factor IF-2 N-terminal domain-containing protein [Myxococcales bacterium]
MADIRVVDVALSLGVTPERVLDVLWSLGVATTATGLIDPSQAEAARSVLKPAVTTPFVAPPQPPSADDASGPPSAPTAPVRPFDVPEALRKKQVRVFEVAKAVSAPIPDILERLRQSGYTQSADHLTIIDAPTVARLLATFHVSPPEGFVESDVADGVKRRRRFRPLA